MYISAPRKESLSKIRRILHGRKARYRHGLPTHDNNGGPHRARRGVQVARTPARWISIYFFTARSLRGGSVFIVFTARSLHGGNHVLLLPRSSCAVLDFNPSAAQSLRGSRPHRSAPCRPYAADVLPRRSGHEICF
jgi:hypothetical protein